MYGKFRIHMRYAHPLVTAWSNFNSPKFFPLISNHPKTDVDEGLEGNSLKVGKVEGLRKDDLCLVKLTLHYALQSVGDDQLQVFILYESGSETNCLSVRIKNIGIL